MPIFNPMYWIKVQEYLNHSVFHTVVPLFPDFCADTPWQTHYLPPRMPWCERPHCHCNWTTFWRWHVMLGWPDTSWLTCKDQLWPLRMGLGMVSWPEQLMGQQEVLNTISNYPCRHHHIQYFANITIFHINEIYHTVLENGHIRYSAQLLSVSILTDAAEWLMKAHSDHIQCSYA